MSTARPSFSLLSVAANIERHKLASGDPWLLLLSLEYPGSANPSATQQYVRLVRDANPFTFDAGDGQGAQEYLPFNFEIGDLQVSTTGSMPEMELKVSNVMRILQSVLEQYGGAVGANLFLYVVNTANPAGEPELALAFTVKQTSSDLKQVTFKLGASSPLRRLFPLFMYRPNYCIWTYNSPALQAAAAANPSYRNPGEQCGYTGISFTASATANTPTLTFTGTLPAGIVVGMAVAGAGVGGNILGIAGSTITLDTDQIATLANVALITGMASCSHTVDGTTGCQAHNNLIRIGTFPGIDTNGAAAAGVI